MITIWHYTNRDGIVGIFRTRIINESVGGKFSARYGSGVYGTTLDPDENTRQKIVLNNWDGRNVNLREDKVSFAIGLEVPVGYFERVGKDVNRDIYKHEGAINIDMVDPDFDFWQSRERETIFN